MDICGDSWLNLHFGRTRWIIIHRGMKMFPWESETKVTKDPGSLSQDVSVEKKCQEGLRIS